MINKNLRVPLYLKRTIKAIQKLTLNKRTYVITVKNIRQEQNVKSSNRSAVRFYTLSLDFLEDLKVLQLIKSSSPKKYTLKDKEKLESLVEGLNPN